MTHRLCWLHLSDLHFRARVDDDRKRVLRALADDIARATVPPQLVFLTGDIAATGQPEEYNIARAWIETNVLAPFALTWSVVFVVPGNHDVDRATANCTLFADILAANTPEEYDAAQVKLWRHGPSQEFISKKLAAYMQFQHGTGSGHTIPQCGTSFAAVAQLGGLRVIIAGINSAWASGDDGEDRQRLLVSREQADRVVEAASELGPAHLRILLQHHPMWTLLPLDTSAIGSSYARSFDFLLTGHVHEPLFEGHTSHQWGLVHLGAGAAYDRRGFPHAYNMVAIEGASVCVRLRRFSTKEGFFGADTLIMPSASENGLLSWQWRKQPRVYIAGSAAGGARDTPDLMAKAVRTITQALLEADVLVGATSRVKGVGAEVWATGWDWCQAAGAEPMGHLADAGLYPMSAVELSPEEEIKARKTYISEYDLVIAVGGAKGTRAELAAAAQLGIPVLPLKWFGGIAGDCGEATLEAQDVELVQYLATTPPANIESPLKALGSAIAHSLWCAPRR